MRRSLNGQDTLKRKNQTVYLNESGWNVESRTKEYVTISKGSQQIKLRDGTTDYEVFKQIFIHQEYLSVLTFFIHSEIELETAIDAGSNIGLTSLFIKSKFPKAKIACIEPENDNFQMIQKNLASFISDHSIQIFKAGLMGVSDLNLSIGAEFRGGGAWAKQTVISNEDSTLKSVTIKDICDQMNFNSIDLLKIDIEGAETFLLESDTDVSFLTKTKVIAIEIHDEYQCREQINTLLKQHHFLLIEVGETTIAINKNFLS